MNRKKPKKRIDTVSKCKDRIQNLLKLIVRARDKDCIFQGMYRECSNYGRVFSTSRNPQWVTPPIEPDWEEEFRNTFAQYANHERLKEPAYIVWVADFIKALLKAEREKIIKIMEGMKRRCDGEFGCGWDGFGNDPMITCGSPQFAHDHLRCINQTLEEVKELIKLNNQNKEAQ